MDAGHENGGNAGLSYFFVFHPSLKKVFLKTISSLNLAGLFVESVRGLVGWSGGVKNYSFVHLKYVSCIDTFI